MKTILALVQFPAALWNLMSQLRRLTPARANKTNALTARHARRRWGAWMALLPALALAGPSATMAAPFTPGNLVIYRVGTGTGGLVNTGNPVFIDEYTPLGTLVQSLTMPTTASGAQMPLIASGTATSEGLLTRSVDGRYLLATGYGMTTGGGPLAGTTASTVPRVVGRVDANGNMDTSTALSDFADGNNPRRATSSDGSVFWVCGGVGGIRYVSGLGASTSVQLSTTVSRIELWLKLPHKDSSL